MGGFHLFEHGSVETNNNEFKLHDDNIPRHPLAAHDLYGDYVCHSIQADINFTSFMVPTEEEIKDKGKSDWLTKSLVLFQTSWFVTQCIAHAIKHLPITHLEIVTFAYAAMNFVIYIFWWNKPHNTNWPVQVFQKPRATQHQDISQLVMTQHLRAISVEVGHVLERIVVFISGGQDRKVDLSSKDRVPRFWGNSTDSEQVITDSAWGRCLFWGNSLHCLGFFISDSHRVVDVASIVRRYNCCPHLYHFQVLFECLAGRQALGQVCYARCFDFNFSC